MRKGLDDSLLKDSLFFNKLLDMPSATTSSSTDLHHDAAPGPEALAQLRASAGRACALLKAMANEDRLLLLCMLAEGERNVGELQAATGIVQPSLSQQLGVLREEGLVQTRREGKFIYYALASTEVLRLMQALHASFCAPQ